MEIELNLNLNLNDGIVKRQTDTEIDIEHFGIELNDLDFHEEVRRQIEARGGKVEKIEATTQPHVYRYFMRGE